MGENIGLNGFRSDQLSGTAYTLSHNQPYSSFSDNSYAFQANKADLMQATIALDSEESFNKIEMQHYHEYSSNSRHVKEFSFSYSNNGTDWTVFVTDSFGEDQANVHSTIKTIDFPATPNALYYRYTIISNYGVPSYFLSPSRINFQLVN